MTTGHHRTRGITVTSNSGNAPATAPDSGAGVCPLLDSFIDPFMIFEPIFDGHGRVIDFRYVELNRASCEYAGVVREDLIGRRVLELYPGEQGSAMTRMYLAAFASGVPLMLDDVHLPFEAVNADRYADIGVLRVGDLLHFTMRDATRRHEAVPDLVQSEARFRSWRRTPPTSCTCATSAASSPGSRRRSPRCSAGIPWSSSGRRPETWSIRTT